MMLAFFIGVRKIIENINITLIFTGSTRCQAPGFKIKNPQRLCHGLIYKRCFYLFFLNGNTRMHFSLPGLFYVLSGILWFIPVIWLLNAIGYLVSYVAIRRGYSKDVLTYRGLTFALIIGIVLGFVLGRLV